MDVFGFEDTIFGTGNHGVANGNSSVEQDGYAVGADGSEGSMHKISRGWLVDSMLL